MLVSHQCDDNNTNNDNKYTTFLIVKANAEKWASPAAREGREHTNMNIDDLQLSDMEASAKLRSIRHEEDDVVMVDDSPRNVISEPRVPGSEAGFAGSDPRMRASQVGLLEDDDEVEEEIEEEEKEDEKEEEKEEDDEKEKEDPIYFQGENSEKGFEVDTPMKPPVSSSDRTPQKQGKAHYIKKYFFFLTNYFAEEEEEFEDPALKDLSVIHDGEDEEFRKMYEKFDFLKSNFDNLAASPRAQNPMRLSISSKFLQQPVCFFVYCTL